MVFPLARLLAFPWIRLFVRRVVGRDHFPTSGPFIIAIKHIGAFDGHLAAAEFVPYLNRHIYFFANVLHWGRFWELIVSQRWAKTLPYYEKQKSLDRANTLLSRGKIIGIFPEGLLQEKNQRLHAKTGAARLAIWNKVPIVPVGIHHRVTVPGGVASLAHRTQVVRNMLLHPRSFEFHVGEPLTLEKWYDIPMTRQTLYEATDYLMSRIDALTNIRTN